MRARYRYLSKRFRRLIAKRNSFRVSETSRNISRAHWVTVGYRLSVDSLQSPYSHTRRAWLRFLLQVVISEQGVGKGLVFSSLMGEGFLVFAITGETALDLYPKQQKTIRQALPICVNWTPMWRMDRSHKLEEPAGCAARANPLLNSNTVGDILLQA